MSTKAIKNPKRPATIDYLGLLEINQTKIISQTIKNEGINIHESYDKIFYHFLESVADWVNNSKWEQPNPDKLE